MILNPDSRLERDQSDQESLSRMHVSFCRVQHRSGLVNRKTQAFGGKCGTGELWRIDSRHNSGVFSRLMPASQSRSANDRSTPFCSISVALNRDKAGALRLVQNGHRAPAVGEALRGHPGQRRHGAPGYAAFRIPRLPGSGVYGARDLRDAGLVRQVRQERSAARDGCRGPGEIAPYEAAAPAFLHEGDAIPVSGDVAGVEPKDRTKSGAPAESISRGLCLSVTSHRFCIDP